MPEKPQDILPIKSKGIKSLPISFDNDKFLQTKNQEILNYNIKLKKEVSELKNDINIQNENNGDLLNLAMANYPKEVEDIKNEIGILNQKSFKAFCSHIGNHDPDLLNGDKPMDILFFCSKWNYIKPIMNYIRKIMKEETVYANGLMKQVLPYFFVDLRNFLSQDDQVVNNTIQFLSGKFDIGQNSLSLINTFNIFTLGICDLSKIVNHKGFYDIMKYMNSDKFSLKIGKYFVGSKRDDSGQHIFENMKDASGGSIGINFIKFIEDMGNKLGIKDYGSGNLDLIMKKVELFFDKKLNTHFDKILLYNTESRQDMRDAYDDYLVNNIKLFEYIKYGSDNVEIFTENQIKYIDDELNVDGQNILLYLGSHGNTKGDGKGKKFTFIKMDNYRKLKDKIKNGTIHLERCFGEKSGITGENTNTSSLNYYTLSLGTRYLIDYYEGKKGLDFNGDGKKSYRESMINRLLYYNMSLQEIGITEKDII